MSETEFDIVVLGGGPGGYAAAIRAAQLRLSAAVVESTHLGGICLNGSCIPTKTLLRSAEINHLLHHLDEFGFAAEGITFDLTRAVKLAGDRRPALVGRGLPAPEEQDPGVRGRAGTQPVVGSQRHPVVARSLTAFSLPTTRA